ncbi:MAG: FAD-binding oxidoreductase, partial [Elusimicrobiota bacterium]
KTITPKKESSENINKLIEEVQFRDKTNSPSTIVGNATKIKKYLLNNHLQILDIKGLNKIVELDKKNFTVEVESGISIKELKQQLLAENLHLDVPDMEGTIGGLIATKSYLFVRDIVLGINLLLTDGSVAVFGGKVVKNVAGYDVLKLICGSWGSFGIILTATLKLSAQPFKKEPPSGVQMKMFKPNKYHKMLKKVFDEKNLFNPWIFKEDSLELRV